MSSLQEQEQEQETEKKGTEEEEPKYIIQVVVDKQFCSVTPTVLTVWKKSLLFSCDGGFTVFDSNGDLVFRMDIVNDTHNLLLMDAQGKPLLTLRRKLPSLHNRWEGFLGDKFEGQKPLFTVRRSSILPTSSSPVEVFMMTSTTYFSLITSTVCADYQVEGSFSQRCCTIYSAASRKIAAEVKRKCGAQGTMLGKDVFSLCVEPGFDRAFMMGLIVILDHITPQDHTLLNLLADDNANPSRQGKGFDLCLEDAN